MWKAEDRGYQGEVFSVTNEGLSRCRSLSRAANRGMRLISTTVAALPPDC
jgi:hypothetical protein